MTKLLLDTDIGSDIDDAVCLAYLLARPDCELLGVTTVSGEPARRAMLVSAQCQAAGRNIPIYPGAEAPLMVEPRQPKSPQSDALARWPHRTRYEGGQAVEFLRSTIRANPGEITLLAIGPLTNIALLFKTDPEIPALLKSFVIMGGDFRVSPPPNWRGHMWEWNIYCDPHAAAMVFASSPVLAVGIEVTTQVVQSKASVREHFAKRTLLQPVLDFAEVWFADAHERITFHDPLAAATIFEPGLCTYAHGHIRVSLEAGPDHARTYFMPDPAGPHTVATTVNAEAFFSEYYGAFDR
jgi:purine nucleosidase